MARILVVDDHSLHREFLDSVLTDAGHEVLQAGDGTDGLALARERHPDLIITDLLMPTMGGVELADRVHADGEIAATPIIFYTAAYHGPEAEVLAESCRVAAVLGKPAEPQEVLAAVERILGRQTPDGAHASPASAQGAPPPRGDGGTRTLALGPLDGSAPSSQRLDRRLTQLLELSLALSSERYSEELLARFCAAAREILDCAYTAVAIFDAEGNDLKAWSTSGLDERQRQLFAALDPHGGVLGEALRSGTPQRSPRAAGDGGALASPDFHPPVDSLLVLPMPLRSAMQFRGWAYFAGKARGQAFDADDEQLASMLVAQLSLAHGNLALYEEIQRHAVKLELEVAERRRAQDELAHRVTHDQVTGLPRFVVIEENLQAALAEAAARASRVVVLYVDIDRFHTINETLGRSVGDAVLRSVGERLGEMVRGHGWVAHVAGDEFAAVLLDDTGVRDQLELAEDARSRLGRVIQLPEQNVYMTCSVGVSCYPDNGTSAQELLREAEAAMLQAKREGRNAVCAFSNEHKQDLEDGRALGIRLRDGIRDGQFFVHYQPMISGQDWQIVGFEALVRWQNPELGLLSPDRFIRVAEELGLIVDIGNFVTETVCRQIRLWLDLGVTDFVVSVNVSASQLHRPDFVDQIRASLLGWDVPPGCLELELTESVMSESIEGVIAAMRSLRTLGVRIALDDFGTGYSSLNYLRHFPVDKLKIDRSFVRDITSDAGSAGICRTVIALGHQLGMTVLAEGVENAAQVGYLLRNECDLFQGYYFSRPVAAAKALELLRHRYILQDVDLQKPRERTLLLVDDEENILRSLTRALRRDGYKILTATGAREALELLAKHDVQVIISDQRMPEVSGTEFLSNVKQMYPETVRMVLSGYTDLTAVTDAINRGAIYKFLTKPWNDDELRTQIRDAFRIAQRQERAKSAAAS